MSVKLAIVGSREFTDYEKLCREVEDWKKNNKVECIDYIVSGGCVGTDKLGERYANDNHIKTIIHLPNWTKYGRAAGPIRNKLIVADATHLIAFMHANSRGTLQCYNYAVSQGVPVHKVDIK